MYDSDVATTRTMRMWRKLGGLFEKASYEAVERRSFDVALRCAQMADVCFWQATGEGDSLRMKDFAPKSEAA